MRCTNWLYRVDALRNHDIREMELLWEVALLCLEYCNIYVALANVIQYLSTNATAQAFKTVLDEMLTLLIG